MSAIKRQVMRNDLESWLVARPWSMFLTLTRFPGGDDYRSPLYFYKALDAMRRSLFRVARWRMYWAATIEHTKQAAPHCHALLGFGADLASGLPYRDALLPMTAQCIPKDWESRQPSLELRDYVLRSPRFNGYYQYPGFDKMLLMDAAARLDVLRSGSVLFPAWAGMWYRCRHGRIAHCDEIHSVSSRVAYTLKYAFKSDPDDWNVSANMERGL